MDELAIERHNPAEGRPAESHRAICNRVEHRLEVGGGTCDHPQDFTCRRQVAITGIHLREQPDVLDRDHRLVGEGRHELDLFVSEGPYLTPLQSENSEKDTLPEHRDSQEGPEAGESMALWQLVFRICLNVGNVNRPALERYPSSNRLSAGASRGSLPESSDFNGVTVAGSQAKDFAVEPPQETL